MFRSFVFASLLASPVMAFTITSDTYLDSYQGRSVTTDANGVTTTKQVDNAHTNYGHNAAIKAVSSLTSTSFPDQSSNVHALFTLPSDFWASIGTGPVQSTTVTYYIRNNSLATNATAAQAPGSVFDPNDKNGFSYRQLELHPLLQSFGQTLGAGTGGSSASTSGGALNTATTKFGPDWYTSDGTTPWTNPATLAATPGASFDSADVLSNTLGSANGTMTPVTWNITDLLNNATTRAEIQANGFLIRVTDENVYTGNEFASLISYDSANTAGSSYTGFFPTVVTAPEPAALCLASAAGVLTLRRRRNV